MLIETPATGSDLGFIYSCLLYGARKGHYSFNPTNPALVSWMRKEVSSIINEHKLLDSRTAEASVFKNNNKRVGLLIICEANPRCIQHEIYALSIDKHFQHLGYGGFIIDKVLERYNAFDVYARCTDTSHQMFNLLIKKGFVLNSRDGDFNVLLKTGHGPIINTGNLLNHSQQARRKT